MSTTRQIPDQHVHQNRKYKTCHSRNEKGRHLTTFSPRIDRLDVGEVAIQRLSGIGRITDVEFIGAGWCVGMEVHGNTL